MPPRCACPRSLAGRGTVAARQWQNTIERPPRFGPFLSQSRIHCLSPALLPPPWLWRVLRRHSIACAVAVDWNSQADTGRRATKTRSPGAQDVCQTAQELGSGTSGSQTGRQGFPRGEAAPERRQGKYPRRVVTPSVMMVVIAASFTNLTRHSPCLPVGTARFQPQVRTAGAGRDRGLQSAQGSTDGGDH